MIMRLALISAIFFHFTTAAFAQTAAPKKKRSSPPKAAPQSANDEADQADEADKGEVSTKNSASARATKSAGIGLLWTPLSDFFLQFGVQGHAQIGRDLQVGALVLAGSKDLKSELQESTARATKAEVSGQALMVYGRYFIGNSFSVLTGLGHRSAKADMVIESSITSDRIQSKFEVASIILPVSLGNHWSWDNGMYLGCDWITAMIPISGKSKSSSSGTIEDEQTRKLDRDIEELGDKLAKTTTLTLLTVNVGFAF